MRRILSSLLLALIAVPAMAHSHRHHHPTGANGGGLTYCTFYRDHYGRTASNLVPRGSWVLLSRGGTSMRVRVTDRGVNHFDLTPAQFRRFAPLHHGVVRDVRWRMISRG